MLPLEDVKITFHCMQDGKRPMCMQGVKSEIHRENRDMATRKLQKTERPLHMILAWGSEFQSSTCKMKIKYRSLHC